MIQPENEHDPGQMFWPVDEDRRKLSWERASADQ
jgi:hypothetical protein